MPLSEIQNEVNATDSEIKSGEGVQWSEYATSYDEYVVPLTCYQDNINRLMDFLKSVDLPGPSEICDLGAGTGIYIKAMSEILPNASFLHIDSDKEMCGYARLRYKQHAISANVLNRSAKDAGIEESSLDLVTSINVIYALPDPIETLRDIFSWLKPGGFFFTIDFGRRQNSLDWTQYFFSELYKRKGFFDTAKAIPSAISLFKRQNEGAAAQDAGAYWLHSTEEFQQTLESVGFSVIQSNECYRGYADLAVCKKPEESGDQL